MRENGVSELRFPSPPPPPPPLVRDEERCALDHKWTFEGHQLGVVSVTADPTGNCKQWDSDVKCELRSSGLA